MAQSSSRTLVFPLAGVSRRGGYREQTRPFSAPWAVNVRGMGLLENRERGGSRPGLSKVCDTDLGAITGLFPVTYLDGSGVRRHDLVYVGDGAMGYVRGGVATETDGTLQTAGGVAILTDAGDEIVFPSTVAASSPVAATGAYSAAVRGGCLYLADSVLRVYRPATGVVDAVAATAGVVPTAQPLVCLYRDRLILAGANHVWYASRQGDPADWDFGADMGDPARAVAGQLAVAGAIGDVPKAVIPVQDKALVFACENSLWVLRGDPATGGIENVSAEVGVIAPMAWAKTPDGLMAFLSNDGVYLWGAGSGQPPARLSEERLPGQLREVSASTNTVTMAYDAIGRGFHLFVTPASGTGQHWWIDPDRKAFWPVVLSDDHQPTAVARIEVGGLAEVVLGCRDGYLRKFDPSATTDDGTAFQSHVILGPVRLAADDVHDAMLAELHGVIADASDGVTWRAVTGGSAEAVADAAVDGIASDLAGSAIPGVAAYGAWTEGLNRVARPRARGAWAAVWLAATGRWSYEAVSMVSRQLGRIRAGVSVSGLAPSLAAVDGGSPAEPVTRIQVRRGTAAEWAAANPVLASGEIGLETDTRKLKIGDGSAWNDTEYWTGAELSMIAGAAVGGHRVVSSDAAEKVRHTDPTSAASVDAVLGVTLHAADADASVMVRPSGVIVESSWAWTVQGTIYCGANGVLTQVLPTSGAVLPVGVATATDAMVVRIGPAVFLA